jgi:hypothetical protein
MKDLSYTIIEKRISRLERLIANEQLNQKNEFLGLGKKTPKADHSQLVIDILNEDPGFDYWKKYRMTRGWQDESGPGYIDLSFNVNNHRTTAKQRVEYTVTLEGRDLKKIKLEITRRVRGGEEDVIISKVVQLDTPNQIRKVSSLIIDSIDRNDLF